MVSEYILAYMPLLPFVVAYKNPKKELPPVVRATEARPGDLYLRHTKQQIFMMRRRKVIPRFVH